MARFPRVLPWVFDHLTTLRDGRQLGEQEDEACGQHLMIVALAMAEEGPTRFAAARTAFAVASVFSARGVLHVLDHFAAERFSLNFTAGSLPDIQLELL